MRIIKPTQIIRNGDFMIVGFQAPVTYRAPLCSLSDMSIRKISETTTTRVFTPGISMS